VPDSIVYVSFLITNGYETDRKDSDNLGYDFNVYKAGKPVKGTFVKQSDIIGKMGFGDRAIDLLEKEYALYPEQRAQSNNVYLIALSRSKNRKEEAKALAKNCSMRPEVGTDDQLMSTYTYYISEGNRQKRDSLEKKRSRNSQGE